MPREIFLTFFTTNLYLWNKKNPSFLFLLRATELGKQFCRKGPGVLGRPKFNMSQQCALTAKSRLRVSWAMLVKVLPEGQDPCSTPVGHTWSARPSSVLTTTRGVDLLEWIQQRATKMLRGLEHLSFGEMLRELGLSGWRREGLRLINVCKYLKEGC